jgi:RNA polymerase sigma factor (sigma-70 family)
MVEATWHTAQLEGCLARFRCGDPAARDELLRQVYDRLQRLTRKMLRNFPGVKRWTETDDVLQNVLLRLVRALQDVQPGSMREFFGLSTELIRRELLDMARHYDGPQGMGAHHWTNAGDEVSGRPAYEKADESHEPSALAIWREFHHQVQGLPEEEREVVGLLFYQELTQAQAAEILHVTVRTVQRRWHAALVKLHDLLKGHWPGV